jgi:acyl carrier protein
MRRSQDEVGSAILGIIADMVRDWDPPIEDKVERSTLLVGDLDFSSVDIISLVVAIEEHFGTRNLGFAELLMNDGRYVDDLSVGDLTSFVSAKLQAVSA